MKVLTRRPRRHGRHRSGTIGLVSCRAFAAVAAALEAPAIARRGLFERLFSTSRHLAPAPAYGAMPALAWAPF